MFDRTVYCYCFFVRYVDSLAQTKSIRNDEDHISIFICMCENEDEKKRKEKEKYPSSKQHIREGKTTQNSSDEMNNLNCSTKQEYLIKITANTSKQPPIMTM